MCHRSVGHILGNVLLVGLVIVIPTQTSLYQIVYMVVDSTVSPGSLDYTVHGDPRHECTACTELDCGAN